LLLLTIDSKTIKKDHRKIKIWEEIRLLKKKYFERRRLEMARLSVMSLEDWRKTTIDEIRER